MAQQLTNGAPAATPRRRPYIKDALRYKTVLCDKFVKSGTCPYGRKCQFAHGADELRARMPSESELCQPAAPAAWQSLSPSAKSLSSSLALSPPYPRWREARHDARREVRGARWEGVLWEGMRAHRRASRPSRRRRR